MSLTTISINGVNPEDLGLTLQAISGFADIGQRTYPTVQSPLALGGRLVGAGSAVGPRTLSVQVLMRPTSFANRQAAIDQLLAMFAGDVEISKLDAPTRSVKGQLTQFTLAQPQNVSAHPFFRPESVGTLTILCPDATFYDRDFTPTWIDAGTKGVIAMGDAPVSKMQIVVLGGAANPVLTLRDQTGTAVETMSLTGTLTSSQWLTIDCELRTILRNDGTDLIGAGWLAMPQTFFNPRPPMTVPTLESSAGQLWVYHRRAWWA